jgi:hypothetical protein
MHASYALLGPGIGRIFALAATNYVYEVPREPTFWVGLICVLPLLRPRLSGLTFDRSLFSGLCEWWLFRWAFGGWAML